MSATGARVLLSLAGERLHERLKAGLAETTAWQQGPPSELARRTVPDHYDPTRFFRHAQSIGTRP
ncbi:hypothetical protein ACFWJT_37970 [Streptomyces sp. NPDC127069]|uniref:hypothetical protein n=1 Tax=Streptomyces sp. NPDC127069 TaxID=3347128 RepID=UPI003664AEE9